MNIQILDNGTYVVDHMTIPLVQFVMKKNRMKACFVSAKENGKVYRSYSMCKTSLDTFDKNRAVEVAHGRMMSMIRDGDEYSIPPSLKKEWEKFVNRTQRYFKVTD